MIRTGFVAIMVVLVMSVICLVSADTQEMPDLVGNWTGTCVGHERVAGYEGFSGWILLLTVTEQRGRAFNGMISFQKRTDNKPYGYEGFSGVIGPDMKTLYLGEYNSGLSIGYLLDPDTLELIFLNNGKNGSAGIDTFTREKNGTSDGFTVPA